ncbi:hypothetical protein [Epilithonimonas sp. UC225_85]|uniref:hypothetical protein n=1 Tax=Epilithonimonas sp. UC225_85 TaxID=3350167 RepID=UPI0036D39BBB
MTVDEENVKRSTNVYLAPMATASFFVIAGKNADGLPCVIRNDEKDIVNSGWKSEKRLKVDAPKILIENLYFGYKIDIVKL